MINILKLACGQHPLNSFAVPFQDQRLMSQASLSFGFLLKEMVIAGFLVGKNTLTRPLDAFFSAA